MGDCLDSTDISRFNEQALPQDEQERVLRHLDACEACARRFAGTITDHDAVAGILGQLDVTQTATGAPRGGRASAGEGRSASMQIDGYTITRELHRGGQGVVFLADQLSTKRRVAVKVLLHGPYASETERRRFEREVELTAQLHHPNIITIFDSGTTSTGQPYFVMDFIQGVPLTHHVRQEQLDLTAALALFSELCEAVQYAHQHGIIHRDLKPSNILVDEHGSPKVLDFGLAKVAEAPLDRAVSMTQQIVGTLQYMSPEQARGKNEAIDTRSDVYTLGVILYELLTGCFPYPVVGELNEILRHIKATPPSPPDRRWTPQGGVAGGTTASGKLRVRCPIDEEVQIIVLRTLAKEPEQRYQSAGELARDIQRYLRGEPIEARRDSRMYLIRMTLKLYRRALAVGAAFLVVVTIASLISFANWRRAEARLVEANTVTAFLEEALQKANPDMLVLHTGLPDGSTDQPGGAWLDAHDEKRLTFKTFLDASASRIPTSFPDHPAVEARLQKVMGEAYLAVSEYDKSETHLQDALTLYEELHDRVNEATCRQRLGLLYLWKQEFSQADAYLRHALDQQRALYGDVHLDVAQSLNDLGVAAYELGDMATAETRVREALSVREQLLHEDHPLLAESYTMLSNIHMQRDEYGVAEPLAENAYRIVLDTYGVNHSMTILYAYRLAYTKRRLGKLDEAEPLYRAALETAREHFTGPHALTRRLIHGLGYVLIARADAEDAERAEQLAAAAALAEEGIVQASEVFGPDHERVAASIELLATVKIEQVDWPESVRLQQQAVDIYRKALGADHATTAHAVYNLGMNASHAGAHPLAAATLMEAGRLHEALPGDHHEATALAFKSAARSYFVLEQYAAAKDALESAWQAYESLAIRDEDTLSGLVAVCDLLEQPEEAARYRALLAP